MAASERGRTLGRYVLEEPIATTANATIWRARERKTGRAVAIKRFHPHLFNDRVARRRMENEARAARRVKAPNVVSAIDAIATRSEFALVFPFVEGATLAERLRESERLSAQQSAEIAADIADALTAIHAAGLVHRDVKPGNVLQTPEGRARLLDFGISRALTDEIELEQSLTGAGFAIGTLPYMAPEQLAAHPATAATDVFALGVVMYEMLAGARPFEAGSPLALAQAQRVPPPRIEDAPAPLTDVTLRLLSVDPLVRPTAAQLALIMRAWLAAPAAVDAATAAVPTVTPAALGAAVPQPVGRSPRRSVLTLAGALVALLVVAVVALAAMAPGSAPAQTSSPDGAVAALPANAPEATSSPTRAPALPAARPAVTPRPTPAQPAATPAPSTQPPSPPPPNPGGKHSGGHHGGHHGHHHHGGHHHHKHRHH